MRVALRSVLVLFLLTGAVGAEEEAHARFVAAPSPETAFGYLHAVATHPRCSNCHGVIGETSHHPTVGDQREPHPMGIDLRHNIVLLPSDHGFNQLPTSGMNCRSCHRNTNGREDGMPPGAANDEMPGFVWHMPPPSMAIPLDLSAAELCRRWLDPQRNSSRLAQRGGRHDLETFRAEFLDHHAKIDPLVQWAWEPGPGRTPAPGSHADFIEAMGVWISAGAPCPEDQSSDPAKK